MSVSDKTISSSSTIDYVASEDSIYYVKSLTTIQSVFKPLLYCIIFLCGLVGNSLVLSILIWFKKLASVTDVYLLNMAISDLIFVFSLPFVVYSTYHQWIFGDAMCKILSAMYYTGFFSGIFFITALSVDRYLAIVHVVFSLRFRTVNVGIIITLAVWTFSFLLSLPHFIYHQQINNKLTHCAVFYAEDQKLTLTTLSYLQVNVLGLIVPLAVLIFCYSRIIANLRNSRSRQKKYAVKLIFIIVFVFFLFWAPYIIVVFLKFLEGFGLFDSVSEELQMAMDITQTISFVHCCLNPIIYSFAGENFKKHLHQIFGKFLKCLRLSKICRSFKSEDINWVSSSFRESRSSSCTDTLI